MGNFLELFFPSGNLAFFPIFLEFFAKNLYIKTEKKKKKKALGPGP
jgi:hypothetical protein